MLWKCVYMFGRGLRARFKTLSLIILAAFLLMVVFCVFLFVFMCL